MSTIKETTVSNLPPAPDGATIYTHPQQGKTIYVLADGSMQVYRANGTRTTSSATPAKLAAGYGAWEQVSEAGAPKSPLGEWTTSAPAPTLPASAYLAPQLALEAELSVTSSLITNDGYVFEQKMDGHRVLLVSPGDDTQPIALTRGGQPYTKGLPRAIREFRFPAGTGVNEIVLDGELVGDTFWVFDLPRSSATNTTDTTPLHQRRVALEVFFDLAVDNPAIRLVPQAKTEEEKRDLAAKAFDQNLEGLVAKRKNAPYRWGGRTEEWLKLKFVTTADCIVAAVRDDGKDSVALSLVDGDTLVDIGRASLIGKEKRATINVGDVLEVKYLYVGANGRLYQPRIVKKRTDKPMHECTIKQLKHVNKTVLETL